MKREVFSRAMLVVFAFLTGEIFAADYAALEESYFFPAQNAREGVHEFFNAVAVAYAIEACLPVVFQA